jgi:hypothetical protein
MRRNRWVRGQALLAPVAVGFPLAVGYFVKARPQLLGDVGSEFQAGGVPLGGA